MGQVAISGRVHRGDGHRFRSREPAFRPHRAFALTTEAKETNLLSAPPAGLPEAPPAHKQQEPTPMRAPAASERIVRSAYQTIRRADWRVCRVATSRLESQFRRVTKRARSVGVRSISPTRVNRQP